MAGPFGINPFSRLKGSRPWDAGRVPGLLGRWRIDADEARLTLVEGSISANLQADWTAVNVFAKGDIGGGVYRIALQNDAGPLEHYVYRAPVNAWPGECTVEASVVGYAGQIGAVRLASANGGQWAAWRLSDGALLASSGALFTPSNGAKISGGFWFSATLLSNGYTNYFLYPAKADGTVSFTATATDTLDVRDVAWQQRRVTDVASLGAPLSPTASLTTVANAHPRVYDADARAWDAKGGLRFSGYALRSDALGAAIAATLDQAVTVYLVARNNRAAASEAAWALGAATATPQHSARVTATGILGSRTANGGGAETDVDSGAEPAAGSVYLLRDHFNGVRRTLGVNADAAVDGDQAGASLTSTSLSFGARAYGASSQADPASMQWIEAWAFAGRVADGSYHDRKIRRELAAYYSRPDWSDIPQPLIADFTAIPGGEGPALLPGGLILTSGDASARTVQTSESTVAVGIAKNRGRFGRKAAAHEMGLVLEGARTNRWPQPRAIPPVGGLISGGSGETPAPALSGLVGPDGTGDAPRYRVVSGGYSRATSESGQPSGYLWGIQWERGVAGGESQQLAVYNGSIKASGAALATTWARRAVRTASAGVARAHQLVDGRDQAVYGGITAGARDVVVDLVTSCDGAIQTEAIQTGLATRGSEAVRTPAPLSAYLRANRLLIALRFRPKGARAEYSGTPPAWWLDANTRAYFTPATGVISVDAGGRTESTSTGATWAADDTADLFIAVGAGAGGVVKFRVNGGAVTTWTLGNLDLSSAVALPIYLMTDNTGSVFESWVEAITIGMVPAWAV